MKKNLLSALLATTIVASTAMLTMVLVMNLTGSATNSDRDSGMVMKVAKNDSSRATELAHRPAE